MFGRGKPWLIWQITGAPPNCITHILTLSHDIKKSNKQKFTKAFLRQTFMLRIQYWQVQIWLVFTNYKTVTLSHIEALILTSYKAGLHLREATSLPPPPPTNFCFP